MSYYTRFFMSMEEKFISKERPHIMGKENSCFYIILPFPSLLTPVLPCLSQNSLWACAGMKCPTLESESHLYRVDFKKPNIYLLIA